MNIAEIIDNEFNQIPDKHLREYILNELLFTLHCFIKEKEKEYNHVNEYFEQIRKQKEIYT